MIKVVCVLFILCLSGCAYCNDKLFVGFGSYKDKNFEMESKTPFEDIINITAGIKK